MHAGDGASEEWSDRLNGWFPTRDQRRLDPLKVGRATDFYMVPLRIVAADDRGRSPYFERAFRDPDGLPLASAATMLAVQLRQREQPPHAVGLVGEGRLRAELSSIPPRRRRTPDRALHRTLKAQGGAEELDPDGSRRPRAAARFAGFPGITTGSAGTKARGTAAGPPNIDPRAPPPGEKPWYDADHRVRRVQFARRDEEGELVLHRARR